jgi:hypothetical protein
MKAHVIRSCCGAALALCGTAVGWASPAGAQTVVVQPGEQRSQPPPAAVVVVNSAAPAPSTEPPIVPAPPVAREPAVEFVTRPNRAWLTTGLLAFGQAYVASIGIAATSIHRGDSNLWIPALGPWLDLGARPGCPTFGDCGIETGLRVLLVADGILQTFGAFEIVSAFLWPETVAVPAGKTASGASVSFAPGRVGTEGYGIRGAGRF